jgi:hypothetical protein
LYVIEPNINLEIKACKFNNNETAKQKSAVISQNIVYTQYTLNKTQRAV